MIDVAVKYREGAIGRHRRVVGRTCGGINNERDGNTGNADDGRLHSNSAGAEAVCTNLLEVSRDK